LETALVVAQGGFGAAKAGASTRHETPANLLRFSRFGGSIQQGPVQRQEAQIVQPCNQLDDFLPGFVPPLMRYCDGIGCNASTRAALNLLVLGFRVRELMGGLDWWKRDGYATAGENARPGTPVVCGC